MIQHASISVFLPASKLPKDGDSVYGKDSVKLPMNDQDDCKSCDPLHYSLSNLSTVVQMTFEAFLQGVMPGFAKMRLVGLSLQYEYLIFDFLV